MTGWEDATGDAFDVVLLGDARGEMAAAVALAGGRVVARPGWDEPVDVGGLVAIDVGGLGEALPASLATLAERADLLACDWEQLDLVGGALLFADAELLCAPSVADRVAALAFAAHQPTGPGGVREGAEGEGAARLRRFSGEVARIADTLARLAAAEGRADLADRRPAYDAGPVAVDTAVDPQTVRQAIRARRLRATWFGDGLFEDPAWDMLLDLFAAELEGRQVSVSSLCIAAHVAPTTALRWIGRLTQADLFERRPDPQDRRRAFMALTARGSAAMRGYVGALGRAGLVLG